MPRYKLQDVHRAVEEGYVSFRGGPFGSLMQSIDDINFKTNDVYETILMLRDCHFHKTHGYKDGIYDDGYKITTHCRLTEGDTIDLYIKLRLYGNNLSIEVGSFHRDDEGYM